MERLTKRDEFGNSDIIGVSCADLQFNLNFSEINRVTNALNKLADYEDAEETGTLVRLPCKVGDTVYIAQMCMEDLMSDALGIINRQKAEIERYLHSIKMLENDVQTAKAEAIKEFAERLKYRADKTRIKNMETEKVVYYMDEFKLDSLVNEMMEGE